MPQIELTAPETKKQPPYGLWLLNDDVHSFAYVVSLLRKVFPRYDQQKCKQLVMMAHEQQEVLIWSGALEHGELKRDQMLSGGPDIHGGKTVTTPVRVRLEPMP